MTAYGFSNAWFGWALAHGQLDDWCRRCGARGITIAPSCQNRDPIATLPCPATECRKGVIPAARRGGSRCLCCGGLGLVRDPHRERCTRMRGCSQCRRRCIACQGRLLAASDVVRREDFGDRESLVLARRLFPGMTIADKPRMDMHARAL